MDYIMKKLEIQLSLGLFPSRTLAFFAFFVSAMLIFAIAQRIEEADEMRTKFIKEKNTILFELTDKEEEKWDAFQDLLDKFHELFELASVRYSTLKTDSKKKLLELCTTNFLYDGENLVIQPSELFNYVVNFEKLLLVEVAGIEPASKNGTLIRLQLYLLLVFG